MKVKQFIKYLETLDENMEIFAMDQFLIGMDGEVLPVSQNNIKITTLKEIMDNNPHIQYISILDTSLPDEEEPLLLLNHKDNYYSSVITMDSIPEIEEKEDHIEIETIEI